MKLTGEYLSLKVKELYKTWEIFQGSSLSGYIDKFLDRHILNMCQALQDIVFNIMQLVDQFLTLPEKTIFEEIKCLSRALVLLCIHLQNCLFLKKNTFLEDLTLAARQLFYTVCDYETD